MDTNKLELQAENYVNSALSKYEFLVSKPQYDTDGCDLQILDNSSFPTRLLRIQSKGRTIDNSTSVEVPKNYVDDNFILFVYAVNKDKKETLYIFFADEIKQFSSTDKVYRLTITKNEFDQKYKSNLFTNDKADQLRTRLYVANIKEGTTILIDAFCLENAMNATLEIYKEIYPEKDLSYPKTLDIIKQIIKCYDKLKLENRIINIYLFTTPHNFVKAEYYDSKKLYLGMNKIRIFELKIDGLVSFEIQDFLNRIISSENIILTATDVKYVPLLQDLQKEKKEIVIVCEKIDNPIRDFGFKWGDIAYPIAFAMGLEQETKYN